MIQNSCFQTTVKNNIRYAKWNIENQLPRKRDGEETCYYGQQKYLKQNYIYRIWYKKIEYKQQLFQPT